MKRKWIVVALLLMGFPSLVVGEEKAMPFFTGEKLTYAITKVGMKAGETNLTFSGPEHIDGKEAYLITFRAKAMNFFDEEKIYVDPRTFLPMRVDRDLNIFGKKEKISEKYQAQEGKVIIAKTVGHTTTEQVIEKSGKVDNIYCFIYRMRVNGKFNVGDKFKINLPTQDVTIRVVNKSKIKAAGKTFDAYDMQSEPKKYRVWFDAGDKKIPLRIDGAVGFGNTAMILAADQ